MKHSAVLWRALFSFIAGFTFITIYQGTPVMVAGMVWIASGVLVMGYGITRKDWMLWGYTGSYIAFALFSLVLGIMGGNLFYTVAMLVCLLCTYFLLAHDPLKHLLRKKTYPEVELGKLGERLVKVNISSQNSPKNA